MDKVRNLADVTAPGIDLSSLPPHLTPLVEGAPADTMSTFRQLLVCLMSEVQYIAQSPAKRLRPGLVNFVPAVAYHLYLNLLPAFTQPGRSLLDDPCTYIHPPSTPQCGHHL